jgi:hypothetical protein
MRQKYRNIKFRKNSLILLEKINSILEEFKDQNITVTSRQLYYQLVSKDIISNQQKEYKKMCSLLTKFRYAGLIDWDCIEDRVRIPKIPRIYEDLDEIIWAAKCSYKLDRWDGQEYHVELWTEKDALSSVLQPICTKYQIPFVVNRGYTSSSAMYDSKERLLKKVFKNKKCIILYLGDHDPSGLDMIRDINERLHEFMDYSKEVRREFLELDQQFHGDKLIITQDMIDNYLEIIPIGITMEQIKEYSPPPNPTKITDTRSKKYIKDFGNTSWEVDSLKPNILQELIEESILRYLDIKKFDLVKLKEKEDLKNWGSKI